MIVGVVQARLSSSRLRHKAILPLAGEPMVARVIGRVCRAKRLAWVVAAIPPGQHPLWAACVDAGVEVVEGPEHDLIERYGRVFKVTGADAVCRITADCVFADPDVIDFVVAACDPLEDEYSSNVHPHRTWPDGLDVEIITAAALERLDRLTRAKGWLCAFDAREEFTRVFWERPGLFRVQGIQRADPEWLAALQWSVNTPEEYAGAQAVYETLGGWFSWRTVLRRYGRKSLSEIGLTVGK